MKLTKAQFSTLSDVCREAANVILGGLIIGGLFAQQATAAILAVGYILYPSLIVVALYFEKKGE